MHRVPLDGVTLVFSKHTWGAIFFIRSMVHYFLAPKLEACGGMDEIFTFVHCHTCSTYTLLWFVCGSLAAWSHQTHVVLFVASLPQRKRLTKVEHVVQCWLAYTYRQHLVLWKKTWLLLWQRVNGSAVSEAVFMNKMTHDWFGDFDETELSFRSFVALEIYFLSENLSSHSLNDYTCWKDTVDLTLS